MEKQSKLQVQETEIRLFEAEESDFFSITDIAKRFDADSPASIIANWMRNKDTVEFLGTWEMLNNTDFKLLEFEEFKIEAGANRFVLSPTKWTTTTNAIGIRTKSGRYGGGTFAHKDIALAFCYWLSPTFQLYVIKEFQRLKKVEAAEQKEALEWNLKRTLSKVNYRIHTEVIRENLVPPRLFNRPNKGGIIYASEADVLNMALYGMTAKDWRLQNPALKGNIRDHSTESQLLVLANLESHNAQFIKEGMSQDERLIKLNEIAIYQMQILSNMPSMKALSPPEDNQE